jgi:hypothetical protein
LFALAYNLANFLRQLVRSAGRCRGLSGGEEPAAATPGLGQTQSGVDPGRKFVAPDPSPEYDGLEDSKPWSRKASIWERSDEGLVARVTALENDFAGLKSANLQVERQVITVLGSAGAKDPGVGGPGRQAFTCTKGSDTVETFPIKVACQGKAVAAWQVPQFGQGTLVKFGSYFDVSARDGEVILSVTPTGGQEAVVLNVYVLHRK